MAIEFCFSELSISGFRGIRNVNLQLPSRIPTYLVGPNNAGKSTILTALALSLRGGGFHKFSPQPHDFFHDVNGEVATDFRIDLGFEPSGDGSLPAVQGVGNPTFVHGIRVLGRTRTKGRRQHRHVLFDEAGKAITLSPRTPLTGKAKEHFKDQNLGWAQYYARLADIRESLPEVWRLTPENLDRSLYAWHTGPLQRLASLLSERFLNSEWIFEYDGEDRTMPSTLEAAHRFFKSCVSEFPFWKTELRPKLEEALGTYLGRSVKFGLQPDIQVLEEWLQQQLAVSFSAEDGGPLIPLPSMGHGWQALVRLAALEVIESFSESAPTPVMLLCEEPEVYLHPHLRRKLRNVLGRLSEHGWLVVSATHAPEFISFREPQQVVRLWREDAATSRGHLLTEELSDGTKFQSRLDERGNHELVLANRVVLCEGKDDVFALRTFLEKSGTDLDARGVTLLDVGGSGNEPDYARMSAGLSIPWCGLTDEDLTEEGTVNPITADVRQQLEAVATKSDIIAIWRRSLEDTLGKDSGKADPEWQEARLGKLNIQEIRTNYPEYARTADEIRVWIEGSDDAL